MANIQKRISKDGKVSYRVLIRLKGFPSHSATFSNVTKAKDWASRTENKIKDGKYHTEIKSRKFNVSDIIDKYKKTVLIHKPKIKKDWESQLNWWENKIGRYTLADVTPSLISETRDILINENSSRGKPRSPATINRYLTTLQCVFSIAVKEWELIEINPFFRVKKLKEPKGRVRWLSDRERVLLLEECQNAENPYLYPVVIIALSTGARKMEILSLKWEDVDLENGRAVLHDTKNDERRSLNLIGKVNDIIKDLYKENGKKSIYLFPSKDGQNSFDITRSWKKAIHNTGIDDFKFHDLRHTTASYLAMQGKSIGQIADVLGHKTLQMVKRYSHLSDEHKKSLTEDVNEVIFGE